MAAPLDGITVVEVDNYMAAPSAGAIMADMGATVIKVEPLTGDPMRGMSRKPKVDDEAARLYDYQFDVDNRGKQSIAVDLTTETGTDLVRRLVRRADIFLCNLLDNRQKRFGLDPDALMTVNPRLVHATLTGYGTDGPAAERPGFDVTAFFGRSGLYDAMREGPQGTVPMARPAQGDHTTGLALLAGILAALRMAERTGEGQAIETSLFETAVWTQATDFATTAVDASPVRQRARHEQLGPMSNRYPCKDGKWIVINMLDQRPWPDFCRAIGRPDWVDDPDLADAMSRYKRMAELVPAIDEALSVRTRDEWGEIFDSEGFIWGPVLQMHEVPDDPQAETIGMFPTIESAEIGEYRTVGAPMRFKTAAVHPRGPAPKIGEHTREILGRAGLDDAEIDVLIASGAVQAP